MGGSEIPRTVYGYITDKNGKPAVNLRVRAFDSDFLSSDDLMGIDFTDPNGYYEIHYRKGKWDIGWKWLTNSWRPDIYIKVSMRVNGRCDDGEWNADANWKFLQESRGWSNQVMRNNRRINLQLLHYPLDPVEVHTFQRGVDMWSSMVIPFYGEAFGCAPNGDKVEWSFWGWSPIKFATRCWNPNGAKKCSREDLRKIQTLGKWGPGPPGPHAAGENMESALAYLVESEEVDESAEAVLSSALIEIKQHVSNENFDKAKEMLEKFKEDVKQESEKNAITHIAKAVLLLYAGYYIQALSIKPQ